MEQLLWWAVAATLILTPLVISNYGADRFHLPKELVLRFFGIAITTIAALGWLWRKWAPRLRINDPALVFCLAAVAWTGITAITSTNRLLSAFALLRVYSLAAFFIVAYLILREKKLLPALSILLAPAVINAAFGCLQEWGLWNPLIFPSFLNQHQKASALIGNVNDVGSFLVVPALVAVAMAAADRRFRTFAVAAAFLLSLALILNQTLTALVAFASGLATMMIVVLSPRIRLAAVGVLTVAVILMVLISPPLRQRAERIRGLFEHQKYDSIVSGRLPAYAAAIAMIEEHPLIGVGPGCYGYQYYFHRLRMEQRYPVLLTSDTRMQSFVDAHNDHLQIAAEAGIPGFAILTAALGAIALIGIRSRPSDDHRRKFVRLFALPFAVSLFVLMLAQFPLQLASSAVGIVYMSAVCAAWS